MKKRQVSTLFSPLAPKYTECSYVSVVLFSLFPFYNYHVEFWLFMFGFFEQTSLFDGVEVDDSVGL